MHSCVTCGVVLAMGSDTELTPKLPVSSKLLNQFIFRITSTIIFILLYKFDEIFMDLYGNAIILNTTQNKCLKVNDLKQLTMIQYCTGSSGHILCGYLLFLLSLTARLSLFINITA